MMLLLFLYFSLLFLYFCTTFSSIGTSTKKVQTLILFLVLVEQKVEVLNWANGSLIKKQKIIHFCNNSKFTYPNTLCESKVFFCGYLCTLWIKRFKTKYWSIWRILVYFAGNFFVHLIWNNGYLSTTKGQECCSSSVA